MVVQEHLLSSSCLLAIQWVDAMVVLRAPSDIDRTEAVQALLVIIFMWISLPDEIDQDRKFDRLEDLRENPRNVVECLGYRACTHGMTIVWQSLTATKIWIDRQLTICSGIS